MSALLIAILALLLGFIIEICFTLIVSKIIGVDFRPLFDEIKNEMRDM